MAQKLQLKQQFIDLIKNYRPNSSVTELLSQTKIVLFDGPSASGRNTIMSGLVETGRFQQIVSDTTRKPRVNNGNPEVNGTEYWFKSEEEFIEGLKHGDYIEAALIHEEQVSGVSIAEIKRLASSKKIGINDVQPDGIEAFRMYKPDTICIFVVPPEFRVWLDRISKRGNTDQLDLHRRLNSAKAEIEHALEADYYDFITNDDLEDAILQTEAICAGQTVDSENPKNIARNLLLEIDSYLRKTT